jgi:hypothetical protein
MAKIVDLQTYRTKQFNDRAFGPWRKRLNESCDENTRISDLSDKTLLYLAQPGDASTLGFYELIMGVLDLGMAAGFYTLDKVDQLKVVEVHLFLADQTRFELMHRLNWITRFFCQNDSLLELIHNTEKLKLQSREDPPELSHAHAGYADFHALTTRDKEAFVRRLLPEAIESFRRAID